MSKGHDVNDVKVPRPVALCMRAPPSVRYPASFNSREGSWHIQSEEYFVHEADYDAAQEAARGRKQRFCHER